jgi:hypothetical protein
MNTRLIELAERRATLVAKSTNQRNELARAVRPLRTAFSVADLGIATANYFKHRPALLAGGIAVAVLLRPGFIFKWLKRGWLAWRFSLAIKRRLSNM